jgi:hypothetical protein
VLTREGALLEKYRELCEKYEGLVRKLSSTVETSSAAVRLAAWTMRELPLAFAIVRDDRITSANRSWSALAGSPGPRRRWLSLPRGRSDEPRTFATLGDVARAVAANPDDEALAVFLRERSNDAIAVSVASSLGPDELVLVARPLPMPERDRFRTVIHDLRNAVSSLVLVLSSVKGGSDEPHWALLDRAADRLSESCRALDALTATPTRVRRA